MRYPRNIAGYRAGQYPPKEEPPMSRSPGATCLVDDCGRAATDGVPLDEDDELDLGVCAHHAGEIAADPSRWRISTIAITAQRSRTVLERVEPTS